MKDVAEAMLWRCCGDAEAMQLFVNFRNRVGKHVAQVMKALPPSRDAEAKLSCGRS